jgi:hypothetical protein
MSLMVRVANAISLSGWRESPENGPFLPREQRLASERSEVPSVFPRGPETLGTTLRFGPPAYGTALPALRSISPSSSNAPIDSPSDAGGMNCRS